MKLYELKAILVAHSTALPRFVLPDGDEIPAHFHITEVGHITKRFIDCGGKLHDGKETCLLQTYVGDDFDHRLNAGTLAEILELGGQVLPHDDIDVEVEYENCAVTQAPITRVGLIEDQIQFRLGEKHTACLAKERCGINGEECGTSQKSAVGAGVGCC
jgi:Family of unknown function (DUF6428)